MILGSLPGSQALIWKKSISKKPWFSETCLGVTMTHACAMADLCHWPSDDICISFFPYLWSLLSPTGCPGTSRHSKSVLQGVHNIEYLGLNGPYESLKENNLLFSLYSSLGGVPKRPFYSIFCIWEKNAYYINAVCIGLQCKTVPGLSRWTKGTEGEGKYLVSAPGNKVNLWKYNGYILTESFVVISEGVKVWKRLQ